ncbi:MULTISPECIES: hypothetical protein [Xanthomonas translucens group]|uniref:hypothetical protein n=1 Tax=Xanthomonas translucens group TaxID=3390202 RepID=UPI000A92E4A5|nr:hypothetical protein [Xanthomonas translucens]
MARTLKCWGAVLIGLAALPAAAAPTPQTVLHVAAVSDEAKVMGYNAPSEETELGAWRGLKSRCGCSTQVPGTAWRRRWRSRCTWSMANEAAERRQARERSAPPCKSGFSRDKRYG